MTAPRYTPDVKDDIEADDDRDAIDIAERRWRDDDGLVMDRDSARAERVGPPEQRRFRVRAGVALAPRGER